MATASNDGDVRAVTAYAAGPGLSIVPHGDVTRVDILNDAMTREKDVERLLDAVNRRIDQPGQPNIVINFNAVQSVSSRLVGAIVSMNRRATARKGQVKLASLNASVRDSFAVTHLDRRIGLYDDVDAAVSSFQRVDAADEAPLDVHAILDRFTGSWQGAFRVYTGERKLVEKLRVRHSFWWEGDVQHGRFVDRFSNGRIEKSGARDFIEDGALMSHRFAADGRIVVRTGRFENGVICWYRESNDGSVVERFEERVVEDADGRLYQVDGAGVYRTSTETTYVQYEGRYRPVESKPLIAVEYRRLRVGWRLLDTATIGRGPDCDLRLVVARISREHARINVSDGKCVLVDLNSRNGTKLNGETISTSKVLVPGDTIEIGRVRMTFYGPAAVPSGLPLLSETRPVVA